VSGLPKHDIDKLDRDVVDCAIRWVEEFPGQAPLTPQGQALKAAIERRHEAMRPRCDYRVYYEPPIRDGGRQCGKVAAQRIQHAPTEEEGRRNEEFRCADHVILVHDV
jgi:hypothetical protein